MSFEKQFSKLPVPAQENLPPKHSDAIKGEIITSEDEDPRVLRKFDELPQPIADYWRKVSLKTRRLIIGDEMILKMPVEEMISDFVRLHPEYRTPEEALAKLDELGKANVSREAGLLPEKDITPRPEDNSMGRIENPNKPALGKY